MPFATGVLYQRCTARTKAPDFTVAYFNLNLPLQKQHELPLGSRMPIPEPARLSGEKAELRTLHELRELQRWSGRCKHDLVHAHFNVLEVRLPIRVRVYPCVIQAILSRLSSDATHNEMQVVVVAVVLVPGAIIMPLASSGGGPHPQGDATPATTL